MVKIKELLPENKQMLPLNLKDWRILYQLDVDSRQSASEIGKKVGLSKQVVTYRINKLIEQGIIQKFYAVLDTSKLGFTTYKIFLRLQNTNLQKQEEIINYLKNHEGIQFFASIDGMFDLVFNILTKSVAELYSFIRELENRYGNYLAEKEIIIMVFSSFFFRDYFINKKSTQIRKPMFFGSDAIPVKMDDIDKKILSNIGIDARIPLVDIARKINLSADTVGMRMRKMEKAQIIQNYILLPNSSLLQQTSYKIMFALRNLTTEREKTFFEYAKTQPNIWFHSKSLGKWDLEINMDVDDANHFRNIMMEIKLQFSDIIKEYNTLQISQVHKFNFYPFEN